LTVSKLLDVVPAHPDYLRRLAEGLRSAGLPH
jgi:hypothetical protein